MLWDEVPTRKDQAKAQGERLAGALGGGAASQPTHPGGEDVTQRVSDVVDQVRRTFPGASVEVNRSRTPTGEPEPDSDDRLSKLERLATLRDTGALTAEEFAQEKARVLRDDHA